MNGPQGAVAPEFELTVEERADARPVPGFHTTRTRSRPGTSPIPTCG